jgi:hypothetical protein
MQAVHRYFNELTSSIGAAWNRFWFTPTPATILGAMRIATGLLALYAVATYAPDLERWFADDGMLPKKLVRELYLPEDQWLGQRSLLDYVPENLLWAAYGTTLAAIGLYTLGVGGRAMAIAATALTLSFFTRAPLVIGELEHILIMLMIYLCVGRCSDAVSISSLWKRRGAQNELPRPGSPINTISLRLIQIHLAAVHLMMGWAQLAVPDSVWWSGEGVWLAAARPGMSLVDLSGLADHPRLVSAWSHLITMYLLAFPVLVWIRLARPLLLTVGAVVWISFALASGWVPFCLAMLTGLMAFVERRPAAAQRT